MSWGHGVRAGRLPLLLLVTPPACGGSDRAPEAEGALPDPSIASEVMDSAVGAAPDTAQAPSITATEPKPDRTPTPPAAEPDVTGVVGAMGPAPMTTIVIRPASGDPVRVEGTLAPEIGRLTGAMVALFGPIRPETPLRAIEPRTYEIVSIEGQKPHVGVLQVEGAAVRLESDPALAVEGAPDALLQLDGAKVYILGPVQNGVLSVSSFGVIRPADR